MRFPNGALALLLPPAVELLNNLPSELLEVVTQFWNHELDGSEALPLMVNLRRQADKVKLARMGV